MPQMMPIFWEFVLLFMTLIFILNFCFWSQFFIFKLKEKEKNSFIFLEKNWL